MPVLNPTIQLVVVYLYTKYEHSILIECGDIFDKSVKELRKDGRTEGRRDGRTDICKPVYPPPPPTFSKRGIIITHPAVNTNGKHRIIIGL